MKIKTQNNWSYSLFCILFIISPLFVFAFFCAYNRVNPFHIVPLWNDEVGWYTQINSVLKYGHPLGYNGYNETHAELGTFGPWGWGIIYAMSLFGKIFGWHYYSPVFMNLFYLMLANMAFLFFANPKKENKIKLIFVNLILYMNMNYMFTAMSECTRFSMSIILAGIFHHLLTGEKNSKKYIITLLSTPFVLLFFIQCYILFSFLMPVYGYVLFRHLNLKTKSPKFDF